VSSAERLQLARYVAGTDSEFYSLFGVGEAALTAAVANLLGDARSDLAGLCCAYAHGSLAGLYCGYPASEMLSRQVYSLRALLALSGTGAEVKSRVKQFSLQRSPVSKPSFYLAKIFVAASCRGAGLGTALLRHFHDVARAGGFDRTSLHVLRGNAAAMALYAAEGYRVGGDEGLLYLTMERLEGAGS